MTIEKPELPEMRELWQQTLGWQPDSNGQHQFQQLYEKILYSNRQFNLTRITEPREFWEKHLWDSLRGLVPLGLAEMAVQKQPLTVIDVGTGAGFPGIPVAITLAAYRVTLVDSTRKKIAFLKTVLTKLGIDNATTLTARAEQLGRQQSDRESYDIALLRAVGSASACAEYALPLLKTGGVAILYRGYWNDEETQVLEAAVEKLGGAISSIEAFTTPLSHSVRHCIYLQKLSRTPAEFPRAVGIPAKEPL